MIRKERKELKKPINTNDRTYPCFLYFLPCTTNIDNIMRVNATESSIEV